MVDKAYRFGDHVIPDFNFALNFHIALDFHLVLFHCHIDPAALGRHHKAVVRQSRQRVRCRHKCTDKNGIFIRVVAFRVRLAFFSRCRNAVNIVVDIEQHPNIPRFVAGAQDKAAAPNQRDRDRQNLRLGTIHAGIQCFGKRLHINPHGCRVKFFHPAQGSNADIGRLFTALLISQVIFSFAVHTGFTSIVVFQSPSGHPVC